MWEEERGSGGGGTERERTLHRPMGGVRKKGHTVRTRKGLIERRSRQGVSETRTDRRECKLRFFIVVTQWDKWLVKKRKAKRAEAGGGYGGGRRNLEEEGWKSDLCTCFAWSVQSNQTRKKKKTEQQTPPPPLYHTIFLPFPNFSRLNPPFPLLLRRRDLFPPF